MAREFRDPCPQRIWTDAGGAFAMGMAAGLLFNGIKGARNAPRGERLRSSLVAMRVKAPILGGQFALWGGCFSSFDCILTAVRRVDDPFNSVTAAFLTGGLLAARQGPKPAFASAVMGAIVLGCIEGVSFWMQRMVQAQTMRAQEPAGYGHVAADDKIGGSSHVPSPRLDIDEFE